MSQFFVAERQGRSMRSDPVLMSLVLLLAGMGLVVLFSASYYKSNSLYDTPFQFITNQCIYALAGLLAAMVISRLRLDMLRGTLPFLILLSFVLLLLTFIPGIGATYLGGRRWLTLGGMSFQPSELVKVVLVFYLASVLAKRKAVLDHPMEGLVPPFLFVMGFTGLIYFQNNFSTAVFILVLAMSIFFMAGVKIRFFILLALVLIPLVVVGVLSRDHRTERLATFLEPDRDPLGSGYQVRASQNTIRSGELWGKGIGLGERKLGYLPEVHNDFIFAVVAEELGFLGVMGVLGLFAALAWRGYWLAFSAQDVFDKLLAFGATTSISLQAMINIAVTAGIVPPTGIPLPFFSSGGSSLFLTFCLAGLLMNVGRRAVQPLEEVHA